MSCYWCKRPDAWVFSTYTLEFIHVFFLSINLSSMRSYLLISFYSSLCYVLCAPTRKIRTPFIIKFICKIVSWPLRLNLSTIWTPTFIMSTLAHHHHLKLYVTVNIDFDIVFVRKMIFLICGSTENPSF